MPAPAPQRDASFGTARGFNVLVVTFDTVRADAVGCYGDPRALTPNIDRLASRGVRFTRAIAPAPTTLPSHSTLFTGLDPLSHGVHNNGTFRLGEERTGWKQGRPPVKCDGWFPYGVDHGSSGIRPIAFLWVRKCFFERTSRNDRRAKPADGRATRSICFAPC